MRLFWQEIADGDRLALTGAGARRVVRAGSSLFVEGDRSNHVMVVLRGWVKLARTSVDGAEALVELRGRGSLLGEMSILEDQPRSASAWAVTPVEVLVVKAGRFQELLEQRPSLSSSVLRDVSHRLRQSTQRQLETAAGDARARLCGRLVELAADGVRRPDGAIDIELGLTQQELAEWIGVSREAVVIALRQLRERGWVETGRKRVRVLDEQALQQAAVS